MSEELQINTTPVTVQVESSPVQVEVIIDGEITVNTSPVEIDINTSPVEIDIEPQIIELEIAVEPVQVEVYTGGFTQITGVASVSGDGVDNSDPNNPVITSVVTLTGDGVDNTDPANPVLSFPTPADIGAVELVVGTFVNNTDPSNPIIVAQDAIKTITTDDGDAVADQWDDTFEILGGDGVNTEASGKTINVNVVQPIAATIGIYKINTTAIVPPAPGGDIIYDNATQVSSLNLYINHISQDTIDVNLLLSLLADGMALVIKDINNTDNYQIWQIDGTPSFSTPTYTIPVILNTSGGTGTSGFTNNTVVVLSAFGGGSGGGGGAGHEIQDNGTPMATEPALNFIGANVSDDPGVATIVEITASSVGADPSGSAATAETNAKAYADGLVVGLWDDRGSFDASGGAYPSTGGSGTAGAVLKGDVWTISVAGTLPTGQVVEVGDVVRAIVNTPGNTQANWAITQNNLGYTAENSANKTDTVAGNTASSTKYLSVKGYYDYLIGFTWLSDSIWGTWIAALTGKTTPVDADYSVIMDSADSNKAKKLSWANLKATLLTTWKDATGGLVGLTLFKINFKNAANTFTSFFTNANTAARTYTFQDRDGTIVDDTDLALKSPLASPTFTGTVTLPKVKLTGTPAVDKTVSGPSTDTFQAGENITEFQLCYYKSDGKWWKADADTESIASSMLGVSLETKTAGNAMSTALAGCFIRNDAWAWTVGAKLYMSTTDGAITETMPSGSLDVIRIIGYAVSADVIYFNPSGSYVTHI